MLHLVHLPSGKVINVGDELDNGFVRLADSYQYVTYLDLFAGERVPCVRVMDDEDEYFLAEGHRFLDYQVIGD